MRLILKAVSVNPFPLHQQFSISYPGLFAPQKIWRSSGNDFTDSFYANIMLTKFLKELKVTSFVGWVELDSYSFSFLTKRRRQILCWYTFQIMPKISTHTQLYKLCHFFYSFQNFLSSLHLYPNRCLGSTPLLFHGGEGADNVQSEIVTQIVKFLTSLSIFA